MKVISIDCSPTVRLKNDGGVIKCTYFVFFNNNLRTSKYRTSYITSEEINSNRHVHKIKYLNFYNIEEMNDRVFVFNSVLWPILQRFGILMCINHISQSYYLRGFEYVYIIFFPLCIFIIVQPIVSYEAINKSSSRFCLTPFKFIL